MHHRITDLDMGIEGGPDFWNGSNHQPTEL
jgi:hypothetical protein